MSSVKAIAEIPGVGPPKKNPCRLMLKAKNRETVSLMSEEIQEPSQARHFAKEVKVQTHQPLLETSCHSRKHKDVCYSVLGFRADLLP